MTKKQYDLMSNLISADPRCAKICDNPDKLKNKPQRMIQGILNKMIKLQKSK